MWVNIPYILGHMGKNLTSVLMVSSTFAHHIPMETSMAHRGWLTRRCQQRALRLATALTAAARCRQERCEGSVRSGLPGAGDPSGKLSKKTMENHHFQG